MGVLFLQPFKFAAMRVFGVGVFGRFFLPIDLGVLFVHTFIRVACGLFLSGFVAGEFYLLCVGFVSVLIADQFGGLIRARL